MTGLQGPAAQVDGDAEFVDDATIDNASYHFDATATYTAVTIDAASPLPSGGTIALDLSASSGDTAFSLTASVTLAAGLAAIVLDGAHDYTADLATGEVTSGESP